MNGQTMDYNNYFQAVKAMPEPVPFCDLPKVKMDFKAILQYARQRGVHPNDLTMQEREQFVSYCDEDLLSARQTG